MQARQRENCAVRHSGQFATMRIEGSSWTVSRPTLSAKSKEAWTSKQWAPTHEPAQLVLTKSTMQAPGLIVSGSDHSEPRGGPVIQCVSGDLYRDTFS